MLLFVPPTELGVVLNKNMHYLARTEGLLSTLKVLHVHDFM